MALKNTFKILFNNFSNVWKLMLYKFIILLLSCGLVAGFVLPNILTIISDLGDTGLFDNVKKLVNDFLTRSTEFTQNVEAVKHSLDRASYTLTENANKLMLSYIYIAVIFLIANVLGGLSELAVSDIINGDMSASAKYGFLSRFTICLGKSFKYRLIMLITALPCYIIIGYVVWVAFSFLMGVIGIFSLFFGIALFIFLLSVVNAFFCCQLPHITVSKAPVFDSIRISFNLVKPRFSRHVSYFVLINISLLFFNVLLALFTCGVGLIVSLPLISLFNVTYRMVIYYEANGLKYYADPYTVIDPKEHTVTKVQ